MKPPADAVDTVGDGPNLLLIHGAGTDRATWAMLVRLLRHHARIITYDRRGAGAWASAAGVELVSIEDHAADAADVIEQHATGAAFVCGVSFGAVVTLELMRRRPNLVRGAVLFEPPCVPRDDLAGIRNPFLMEFERLVGEGKGELAAERFHRRRLSDPSWERLPAAVQARARSVWRSIYGDLVANAAYRPRYDELSLIDIPVVLLRGGGGLVAFEPTLHALAAALPQARRQIVPAVGHHFDARAWRELAAVLTDLMGG